MVLGLRTKSRRGATIQVEYIIYIQEIKPWPPSQSLRSLRSVLLQWENGEKTSGSIGPVVPSVGSVVGEGRIEFNESIKLSVALSRELSSKGGNVNSFQRNCLELNLYEPRRDKSNKGQHLASGTIDLAEYATIKRPANVSIPMNSKRSVRNTAQPSIFLKIQLSEKDQNSSSPRESPSMEISLDSKDSVSTLMNEEYPEEEAEIASFTDEDASSHSSLTIPSTMDASGSSISENGSIDERKWSEQKDDIKIKDNNERKSNALISLLGSNPAISDLTLVVETDDHARLSSQTSLKFPDFLLRQGIEDVSFIHNPNSKTHRIENEVHHKSSLLPVESEGNGQIDKYFHSPMKEGEVEDVNDGKKILHNDTIVDEMTAGYRGDNFSDLLKRNDIEVVDDARQESEDEDVPAMACKNGEAKVKESCSNEEVGRSEISSLNSSVVVSVKSNGLTSNSSSVASLKNMNPIGGDESNFAGRAHGHSKSMLVKKGENERRSRHFSPEKVRWLRNDRNHQIPNNKLRQLEQRVECLESELQEAASLELSLYSIVAEHGSSTQKVHAPARRLSRLYTYSLKQWRRERRANSAKSIVSGLVLVAKACGHDVPRLTFWLSNSIVLRTIITRLRDDSSHCSLNESCVKRNGFVKESEQKAHSLKWKTASGDKTREKNGEWEDPCTFISMLEKIEGWIFFRIIESIWWQSLTPHMQSPVSNELDNSKLKKNGGRVCLSDQQAGHFSITLWKKAFKEACERICPVRAAGHECGCLPVLARLIMEQCVKRLDVAMFNAILRESEDDIPTDPVSDPIGDPRVLPISSGKTSFGAGAQLKNAIGNWSRWLTDLFGIDDDDSFEENEELNHGNDPSKAFKTFHLLNSLSDLLMLPKDMLLDKSSWREVCPTFAAPMVKRILETFVVDEFCSDPIPDSLFEALESEDFCDETKELISHFPCDAVPVIYQPPSAATVSRIIGDVWNHSHLRRSASSVIRKGQTSDDELQELELPLASVFLDTRQATGSTCTLKGADNKSNVVRFGLLRDVWRDGD